jgi:2-polyprenyl-3-methyl-5-hydroxy-6-metoxy-1,4-benzoquinol methylase
MVLSETKNNSIAQKVEINSNSYYFSEQQLGIDNRTKRLVMEQVLPYVKGQKVMELGFVDGMFTDMLIESKLDITIVEGASRHVEYAALKYKDCEQVKIVHDYFETFDCSDKYDTIIAGDMIQYLDKPIDFFSKARKWLANDGILLATTPNSRSFHRRIGAYLGVTKNPESVNTHERATGNIIMYDTYQLRNVLEQSGLRVNFVRGCFLKPLSSKQIIDWDDSLLRAFLAMGDELGDYGWFLIAHCS